MPDRLRPGSVFRDRLNEGGSGPEMVSIPVGQFYMGATREEPGSYDTERPRHLVKIERPFAIGRYPVTFDDYDQFRQPDDAGWGRGKRPVITVSWEEAVAYCDWLTQQTGQRYRLSTEAEWEYACRAGTTTPWSCCANENALTTYAWFSGNSDSFVASLTGSERGKKTHPVGEHQPNPWGLYDMHGNVWEWVQDCWHDYYAGAPQDGCAWVTDCSDSGKRVLRGGSWASNLRGLRSASRLRIDPSAWNNFSGFRLARTLTP